MLACCLWDGILLLVVIAACEAGVCELEVAMLLSVENTFLEFSLKLRLFANSVQFCVCCSLILVFIWSLSDWTLRVMSVECGGGVACRVRFRSSMRRLISGVKLGLCTLRLPLGICILAIFVIIALNLGVIVSMFVMLVVSSVAYRFSVSSVNFSQSAFL